MLERLPGAQKATTNCEVDVKVGQLGAELARLRPASRSQSYRESRIAAEQALEVRGGLGVARKNEQTWPSRVSSSAHAWRLT